MGIRPQHSGITRGCSARGRFRNPVDLQKKRAGKGTVDKMKKMFALAATIGVLLASSNFSFAQGDADGTIVIREAEERRRITVAVEAYLIDDILEVAVTVRTKMRAAKLRIFKMLLVGPKLGRISPKTAETIAVTVGDEAPFPTIIGTKTEMKIAKGTPTKELFRFEIPADKIVPGGRYQIWVDVQNREGEEKGRIQRFKFDLENLTQLISD